MPDNYRNYYWTIAVTALVLSIAFATSIGCSTSQKRNLEKDTRQHDKTNGSEEALPQEIGEKLRHAGERFHKLSSRVTQNGNNTEYTQNSLDPRASLESHDKPPPSSINASFSKKTPEQPSVSGLDIGMP